MTDPKILAKKFNDAFNAHDENALKSLTAPNAKLIAPGDVRLEGRDAVTGYGMAWLKAFPDARITVTHDIVSGPWIVQEFTFEGTHRATLRGPQGEIPATNKKLVGKGVTIDRYENDLIVDSRLYFDMVEILTQLGLMPAPVKV